MARTKKIANTDSNSASAPAKRKRKARAATKASTRKTGTSMSAKDLKILTASLKAFHRGITILGKIKG